MSVVTKTRVYFPRSSVAALSPGPMRLEKYRSKLQKVDYFFFLSLKEFDQIAKLVTRQVLLICLYFVNVHGVSE